MAFRKFDAVFSSTLPKMRAVAEIGAAVGVGGSGGATDATSARIAAIELQIHNADALFGVRQYDPALQLFRQARGSIYALLYPSFNVGVYTAAKDVLLPVSKALENGLLELSLRVVDAMRPLVVDPVLSFASAAPEAMPAALAPFAAVGFREAVGGDEVLQSAASRGVALLGDGKPEAAIGVMSAALAQNPNADPALLAALNLNLAAAFVQTADSQRALQATAAAQQLFERSQDGVGMAQALHVQAVATLQSGDAAAAKDLFARAAAALQKATGPATSAPGAPAPGALAALGTTVSSPVDDRFVLRSTARPVALAAGSRFSRQASDRVSEVSIVLAALPARDPQVLTSIAAQDARKLVLRVPGRADGWSSLPVVEPAQRRQLAKPWQVSVSVGEAFADFAVASGAPPAVDDLVAGVYTSRVDATDAARLHWQIVDTASTAFYLTQLYAYALAVKIGDCYHQLGLYAKAEEYYLQASGYTYLNPQVEAMALWIRLARNTVEWGDALYKNEDAAGATAQYSKLVAGDATVPDSPVYALAAFAVPAGKARDLVQNLLVRPLPDVDWEIAFHVMTAFSRLQQLSQGLDFYGLLLSPIHTFEYLQSVCRGFAQEAVQAEREFVNFKTRQEGEEATRRDLETASAMAAAEAESRRLQYLAAEEDATAATHAVALATKRRDDATAQELAYESTSADEIWARAAAQALGAGQDALPDEIGELANRLERGEQLEGKGGKLAAALTLLAGRRTQQYEIAKMKDNIAELEAGIVLANDQLTAAVQRAAAAEILWQAALQRTAMATASLDAFDAEFFTPEAWSKMADVVRDIGRSYLFRAIRTAKLMERAYNFENDTDLKVIRNEYGIGIAAAAAGRDGNLFGGDMLLEDIDSFTYNAIATKTRKSSRIKDVISIAATFPAHFEDFRRSGLLAFETELYELDRLHPGFFGQRIEAVEVEIVGLLPETGLNGTLSAGGVTAFRKRDNTAGRRTHQIDTLALSSFVLRGDAFLYGAETGVRGLFQGLGVGSTWQLHLPKRSNDFDFRRIFDVRLILYYTAQFDAALRTAVLAAPPRPGETSALRTYALRYDFPDAWYAFYRGGAARFELDRPRLPANQTSFLTTTASFRVVTRDGVANQGIELRITAPNGAAGAATTNAMGLVSSLDPALAGLAGQPPLGTWSVEVLGGEPLLDEGGALKLDRVYNLQIGLEYSFDLPPEVI